MEKLLQLLQENARYTDEQLAVMLGKSKDAVAAEIAKYEKDGVIKGYKAIYDWDKINTSYVVAFIELKVTPKRDLGFDEVAKKIAQYEEVESVYLMSGGYDLSVTVAGKSFKDIALFVSQRLATLDSVVSTATHFVLSRYKEKNVVLFGEEKDERSFTIL